MTRHSRKKQPGAEMTGVDPRVVSVAGLGLSIPGTLPHVALLAAIVRDETQDGDPAWQTAMIMFGGVLFDLVKYAPEYAAGLAAGLDREFAMMHTTVQTAVKAADPAAALALAAHDDAYREGAVRAVRAIVERHPLPVVVTEREREEPR